MDLTQGSTIVFSVGRRFGYWPVFKAVVGRNPTASNDTITNYIYLPSQRIALTIHGLQRITDKKERDTAHLHQPDMPDAIFIDGITAKRINSRRKDNSDCLFKGCFDRYTCIWFNAETEKGKNGRRKPYNKIPKTHKVGAENCPRFFNRDQIKVVKRTKPTPPPPKPRPPLMFYIVE